MKYSSFLMFLPFLQNRSSITCSDDLLGVVRITKEMIENTCEVIGKGIKTGREGEGKRREKGREEGRHFYKRGHYVQDQIFKLLVKETIWCSEVIRETHHSTLHLCTPLPIEHRQLGKDFCPQYDYRVQSKDRKTAVKHAAQVITFWMNSVGHSQDKLFSLYSICL